MGNSINIAFPPPFGISALKPFTASLILTVFHTLFYIFLVFTDIEITTSKATKSTPLDGTLLLGQQPIVFLDLEHPSGILIMTKLLKALNVEDCSFNHILHTKGLWFNHNLNHGLSM